MQWPGDGTLIATCGGGAEDALAGEITDLGYAVSETGHGAVRFAGSMEELAVANLRLRTASRVLVPIATGRSTDYESVYRLARTVPWARLIAPSQTIAVSAVTRGRSLSDSRLVALKVKDAIVDSQRRTGHRSNVDRRHPDIGIVVHAADGTATVSLDASGAPLHERGYRREAGDAPMRETVAAAMIRYAGWDGTSTLLDPMCGSGTIVIEAAMIAAGIAPGATRTHYAIERWSWIDMKTWSAERARIASLERAPAARIVARDIDPRMIAIARRNAERAGVADLITFEVADFFEAVPPDSPGIVVTNPPYGERLSVDEPEFYRALGDRLKTAYGGWSAWVISASRPGLKSIGLRTSARHPLWNGGLNATLVRIDVYPPRKD